MKFCVYISRPDESPYVVGDFADHRSAESYATSIRSLYPLGLCATVVLPHWTSEGRAPASPVSKPATKAARRRKGDFPTEVSGPGPRGRERPIEDTRDGAYSICYEALKRGGRARRELLGLVRLVFVEARAHCDCQTCTEDEMLAFDEAPRIVEQLANLAAEKSE